MNFERGAVYLKSQVVKDRELISRLGRNRVNCSSRHWRLIAADGPECPRKVIGGRITLLKHPELRGKRNNRQRSPTTTASRQHACRNQERAFQSVGHMMILPQAALVYGALGRKGIKALRR